MSRQKATNYFSHDSNARNDEKLVRLRMKHSAAGYGVYFMLLERLREEADYMSVKDYNMLAFDLRVDAALIKSVIEDFGLFAFTEDGKCFYSESFNRRMDAKDAISRVRSEAGLKSAMSRKSATTTAAVPAASPAGSSAVSTNVTETGNKCSTNVTETGNNKVNKENKEKEKEEPPKGGKKKDALSSSSRSHSLELLEKRKAKFRETLVPFEEKYGKEMIEAFFGYWTQPNASHTKMGFELQKTWETSLRLAQWERNEEKYGKPNSTTKRASLANEACLIEQRNRENEERSRQRDEWARHSVSHADAKNSQEYLRALQEN